MKTTADSRQEHSSDRSLGASSMTGRIELQQQEQRLRPARTTRTYKGPGMLPEDGAYQFAGYRPSKLFV